VTETEAILCIVETQANSSDNRRVIVRK